MANRPAFLRPAYRAFFAGVIQNLITIGWVTFAMSSIITTMTSMDKWWAIGVCMIVALIYSTFSGFYGVVVTDLVQFFIAVFSMTALAVIAVAKVGRARGSFPENRPQRLVMEKKLLISSPISRRLIWTFWR